MRVKEILNEYSLPKNQWEFIYTDQDKLEVASDLIPLVKNAYQRTEMGSFVNTVKDVIPSDWYVLNWDDDEKPDVCIFCRKNRPSENWVGVKIQGIGHDGSNTSKQKLMSKLTSLLNQPGIWIEASGKLALALRNQPVPIVSDERLLNTMFNNIKMIDQYTYNRKLTSGEIVTETVFGKPRAKNK